jgi:hypothetical protein
VGELLDAQDVTGAAVAGLEATLARIERAEALGGAGGGGAGADPALRGRRPGAAAGSAPASRRASGAGDEEGAGAASSLALVSRELVRSQMAAADLQRKLRVCARCGGRVAGAGWA